MSERSPGGDGGGAGGGDTGDIDGTAAEGGSARVRVCDAEELPPGERALVDVDGTVVCVLNVDGEYYAIQNECAHQGGPVCKGKVHPELLGEFVEPGERVRERHGERMVVACPWHGWEYDLETGDHLGVKDISIEAFSVAVEDGVVYVETSAAATDS